MLEEVILIISLFFVYFHISGLATTNIIRLTAGNTLPVLSSKCSCDSCGQPITPLFQLPIISYIICKGKCRKCKTKIPLFGLALELAVFAGMCLISAFTKFSPIGICFAFAYYELIRVITVIFKGKRRSHFWTQYLIAVVSMLPFFLASIFISLIYMVI